MGARIRTLRKARKWTQGQLLIQARRHIPAGKKLARETLSRIENGQERVDLWVLEACAAALDVGVDDLLRGDPAHISDLVGNEAMPVYTPDVAELAARLSDLPAARRAQAIDVMNGVLDLGAEADGEDEGESSAFIRQLATYVDDLNEDDQQFVLEQIRDLKRRRASAAPRGGQPATG
jgi:transcriptional regulator with XRE-family HTH domain